MIEGMLSFKLRTQSKPESNLCLLFCCVRARQQAKMAEYCRTIFGSALLIDPLDKYPVRLTPVTSSKKFLNSSRKVSNSLISFL